MKIYTRGGDKGYTALIGGERVPKDDARVEAYGTVDELMAFIGLLITQPESGPYMEDLHEIQQRLMELSAVVAISDKAGEVAAKVPPVKAEYVVALEQRIDKLMDGLPELRHFVLPGGRVEAVALTHVARTIARRAERRIVGLHDLPKEVQMYVNRLSDYFFALGRRIAYDHDDEQLIWQP